MLYDYDYDYNEKNKIDYTILPSNRFESIYIFWSSIYNISIIFEWFLLSLSPFHSSSYLFNKTTDNLLHKMCVDN